jgi:cyclopropane fatty-acyl-phospholipid synthase-like methyltransferase
LENARFENSDFLKISFDGYDVITAVECLNYLAPEDQEVFFEKVAREHGGKIMILSAQSLARTSIASISHTKAYLKHSRATGWT